MPITGNSGVGRGSGVDIAGPGCLLCQVDFRIRCDMEKPTWVYTEFLNIAKIWTNLAPVLRIWPKRYLSGESGGERKEYPSANPAYCNRLSQTHVKGKILKGFTTSRHILMVFNTFVCVFSNTVLQMSWSCQDKNQVSGAWNSMSLYSIGKALLE